MSLVLVRLRQFAWLPRARPPREPNCAFGPDRGKGPPPLLSWFERFTLPSIFATVDTFVALFLAQRKVLRQDVHPAVEAEPLTSDGRIVGKRPLTTAAAGACGSGAGRVKHTVLIHVVMDGKRHGGRDHFDGRTAAALA